MAVSMALWDRGLELRPQVPGRNARRVLDEPCGAGMCAGSRPETPWSYNLRCRRLEAGSGQDQGGLMTEAREEGRGRGGSMWLGRAGVLEGCWRGPQDGRDRRAFWGGQGQQKDERAVRQGGGHSGRDSRWGRNRVRVSSCRSFSAGAGTMETTDEKSDDNRHHPLSLAARTPPCALFPFACGRARQKGRNARRPRTTSHNPISPPCLTDPCRRCAPTNQPHTARSEAKMRKGVWCGVAGMSCVSQGASCRCCFAMLGLHIAHCKAVAQAALARRNMERRYRSGQAHTIHVLWHSCGPVPNQLRFVGTTGRLEACNVPLEWSALS